MGNASKNVIETYKVNWDVSSQIPELLHPSYFYESQGKG